jgi:hypothetical protein
MNPIEIIEILVIAILIPIAIFLWLSFIGIAVSIIRDIIGLPVIKIKIDKGDEKDE